MEIRLLFTLHPAPLLRTVLFFFLFTLLLPVVGSAQTCFTTISAKGDAAFSSGLYSEAVRMWQNAKKCSDAPDGNDLDSKIQRAEAALKAKVRAVSRAKEKQSSDESDSQTSNEEKRRDDEQKSLNEERAKFAAENQRLKDEKALADARVIITQEKRIADEKKLAEAQIILDEKATAETRRIAEERIVAEMKHINDEKAAAEVRRLAEERRIADEKIAAEQKKIADQKIREDENSWRKSETANTIAGYNNYLTQFSTGYYIKEAEYRIDSLEIKQLISQMLNIQGGSFVMGSNNKLHKADVRPSHRVHIKAFYLDKYEVTQAEWKAVMGKYPEGFVFKGCGNCPVYDISWIDVQLFLATLSHKSGKNFRLPTEAEWEYAAAGGKDSKEYKFSGDNIASKVAWYDANSEGKVSVVGKKTYNELSLCDMSGNVQEWCQDGYSETYYKRSPSENPVNTGDTEFRVTRGGSYKDPEISNTVTARDKLDADKHSDKVGFRVALDVILVK